MRGQPDGRRRSSSPSWSRRRPRPPRPRNGASSGARGRGASSRTTPDSPKRGDPTRTSRGAPPCPVSGGSSPVVANNLVVTTTVLSEGDVETPEGGWYGGGELGVPEDVHHWLVYWPRLATGEVRWSTEVHTGVPRSSHHLKKHLRVGDAGHRRRADLCALWQRRSLRTRLRRRRPVVAGAHGPAHEKRLGHGLVPVLHAGRVYLVVDNEDESYLSALSAETGGRAVARRT